MDDIKDYLPLVERASREIKQTLPAHISLDDLRSSGMEGLSRACADYDDTKGKSFEAYAYYRIRHAIYDDLRRMDPVGRYERQKIKAQAAYGVQQEYSRFVSLDGSEGNATGKYDYLVDDRLVSPDEMLEQKETVDRLSHCIGRLSDQEQLVVSLHYVEELTIAQIADVLELSAKRIYEIHASSIKRLRGMMSRIG